MNSNENMTNENAKDDFDGRHCKRRYLWKIPFIIAAVIAVKSALVMLLWNAIIPDLFSGPTVTFIQAAGLTILAKLLTGFGGFGRGGWGGHGGFGGGHRLRHRLMAMTPEEREKLRDEMRGRCGF